jgi:hypothetical protein
MRPAGGSGCSEFVQPCLLLRAKSTRGLVADASSALRALTSRNDAEGLTIRVFSIGFFSAEPVKDTASGKKKRKKRVLARFMVLE